MVRGGGLRAGPEHWAVSEQRRERRGPFEPARVQPLAGLMRAARPSRRPVGGAGRRRPRTATLRGLDQVAQAALALDGAAGRDRRQPAGGGPVRCRVPGHRGALRIADPRARGRGGGPGRGAESGPPAATGPSWCPGATGAPGAARPWPWRRASARRSSAPARSCSSPTSKPSGGPIRPCSRRSSASPRRRARARGTSRRRRLPGRGRRRLGLAVETVRSQIKAVFAKTGTGRQGALVALLGAPGLG